MRTDEISTLTNLFDLVERLRLQLHQERARTVEECARLVELIAADWRAAGADQRVYAAEYLAREIRDLAHTAAMGTTNDPR